MDRYLDFTKQFIKFKSISTDPQYKGEISKTADFLKAQFETNKFEVEIIEGYGNPIVMAKYIFDKSKPTCLIYGHYDVQPADKSEGWDSEPFELTERDGRLYARGSVDNKGQVAIHIVSIFNLIKENKLKYNIKFMVEGDEETGSPLLEKFINENKDKLKADLCVISDGEITQGLPIIEAGFRGGFNSTLTFKTANYDLHSGIYGGAVPNAVHELSKFIANLYTESNSIGIEGFYKDVDEIPQNIIENDKSIPYSDEELERITGVKKLKTEEGFDIYTQTGLRPTIQTTGIEAGYNGDGYRNSIPKVAKAKLNFRLVKSQKPEEIIELFKKYLKQVVPEYIEYKFETVDPYEGIKVDLDNNYVKDAFALLEKSFGEKPIYKFSGGGLPIVTYIAENLKIPSVLIPLCNEDCNMHGANENYEIDLLQKCLRFSNDFFKK